MLGHEVTVYDSKSEAGGMLRFALPEYRLPKAALRREIELIERLGVKFIFNTRVGLDVPLNELADRFDSSSSPSGLERILGLSAGHGVEGRLSRAALPGSGGERRESAHRENVAIIGGGNAAIDSARTALRRGAEVTVFYRREIRTCLPSRKNTGREG